MTATPEAIEAGAKALYWASGNMAIDAAAWADAQRDAALVLHAAEPHTRRQIAGEVDLELNALRAIAVANGQTVTVTVEEGDA